MKKIAAVLVILVLCAACSGGSDDERGSGPGGSSPEVELIGALEPFDDCDELAEFAAATQARLLEDGAGRDMATVGQAIEGDEDSAAADAAPAPAAEGALTPATSVPGSAEYSTTNNQEAAVDEADLVKTDGELVLTTVDGQLRVMDATASEPTLIGNLDLPGTAPHELLLSGDRLLVLSMGEQLLPGDIPPGQEQDDSAGADLSTYVPSTLLTDVDLSEPTAPEVVSSRQVDGSYLTARSSEGTARIVVTSYPPMLYASLSESELEALPAEAWLPSVATVTDEGSSERAPLVECADVSRPASTPDADPRTTAGASTVSVLSVDLTQPLDDLQAVSVMADAETVYASVDHLYVATTRWEDHTEGAGGGGQDGGAIFTPGTETTELHQFAIDEPGPARYLASGDVDGRLLNQFALSEHEGRLRVATTVASWEGPSESAIAVLERSGDELVEVGRVDGMGEGEEIYSVRYLGDTAYVVTFRQTDPLYTVDLSDPTAPAVVGELKIPGYSAYLHPVGDGLLLGVGQDADEDTGRTRGTQVSLFDVSNPAEPVRLQQYTLPSGTSAVEYDHRAFLWWGAENLAIIPHDGYDRGWSYNAAIGLDVGADAITERGRIDHLDEAAVTSPISTPAPCPPEVVCIDDGGIDLRDPYGATIVRSLVIGDQVWTVSGHGVEVSDLDTLTHEAWIAFRT
jgi:hypothetical protein